jgi:membrane protease YdiL (CAAX protease family)
MIATRQRWLLLSPLLIILLGHLTIRTAWLFLGLWAWVPLALVYWGAQGYFIVRFGEPRKWLAERKPGLGWKIGTVIVGLIPMAILILNYQLLAQPTIFIAWLLFALINPWFEEGYWRGLLGDATASWPAWLSAAYTTVLFTLSHPLMWGVTSIASRNWQALLSLLMMGWVWSYTYRRTGSLRWVIFSHVLVDLGNLAVPTFLNLYIPPH